MLGYIALGCVPVLAYWLLAYKATHRQRDWLVRSFFTVVLIVAVLGALYELVTTGSITPPPRLD